MTISNQTNRVSATGSGSTGQEVPFNFPINATSDLAVYKRVTATGVQTLLAETTNYTVVISGSSGGTLTTVTTIETTEQIHIIRDTPDTQLLDLEQGGSFNAENVETALDKNTKLAIEKQDDLNRTLVFPATDPTSSFADMPNSVDRAGKNLTFDSDGKPTASVEAITDEVTFSDIGKQIAGAANALAERGILELDTDDNVEFAAITGTTGTFSGAITGTTGTFADIITKGPWFDVRAYGAVGDGVTDDYAAIQAAIDAAEAAGGGIVFLPEGIYSIATGLIIKNCTLLGVGLNTVIAPTDAVSIAIKMKKQANSIGFHDRKTCKNFRLDGSATTGKIGIVVGHADTFNDSAIQNVEIVFFDGAGGVGLNIREAVWLTVRNCLIKNNDIGIHISSLAELTVLPTTTTIDNCYMTSNTQQGIFMESGWGVYLNECIFELNGDEGFKLALSGASSQNKTVLTNCWFEANHLGDGDVTTKYECVIGDDGFTVANVVIKDTIFVISGATAKALDFNKVVDCIVDNVEVNAVTDSIRIQGAGSSVRFVNAPRRYNGGYAMIINNVDSLDVVFADQIWTNTNTVVLENAATPSVKGFSYFTTGGTTTITDLVDGGPGQVIIIRSSHAVTITDGANIALAGSTNWTMAIDDVLVLHQIPNRTWQEMGRHDEDSIISSDGTTGGTASAGAGNQHVEITINGTTYKVLHDGTV